MPRRIGIQGSFCSGLKRKIKAAKVKFSSKVGLMEAQDKERNLSDLENNVISRKVFECPWECYLFVCSGLKMKITGRKEEAKGEEGEGRGSGSGREEEEGLGEKRKRGLKEKEVGPSALQE